MRHSYLSVLGKPFFSIGGQVHNSSAYPIGRKGNPQYEEDSERSFESVKAIGGNTIAVPICWDAFEPEEGAYNAGYVHTVIDNIRRHGLHGTLLWFGTWKNGQMEYTPSWVKKDRERFPRVLCKDGTQTTVLSPHSRRNLEQDAKAFRAFMEILREYDGKQGTILAVQVENEPGFYAPTRRDFSEAGTEAFEAQVPDGIRQLARTDCGAIHQSWVKNGSREQGNWREMFGSFGAELCSAWAVARYIDEIAAGGKEIYDIFMYTNVWMDRNSDYGWNLAGLEYPCGGAVSKCLPLWHCACGHLDAVCPDIYEQNPDAVRKAYGIYEKEEQGWPLYVPESGLTSVNAACMFDAVGKHNAIGYHVFGIESCLDSDGKLKESAEPVMHSFAMLTAASGLLLPGSGVQERYSFFQSMGQDSAFMEIGRRRCRISYAGVGADYAGWVPFDYHHGKESSGDAFRVPVSLNEETARGLLFRMSEDEFYLVGHKVRLFFTGEEPEDGSIPVSWMNGQHLAHSMEFLCLEEGHFEEGKFVTDRVRSGDEARHGIWAQYDCGVVHFILGK